MRKDAETFDLSYNPIYRLSIPLEWDHLNNSIVIGHVGKLS